MLQTWRGPAALMAVVATTWLPVVTAIELTYCATNNTATMENFLSNLQTNGLCHDHCFDDYAFSITQKFNCWCSNYAPDDSIQVDLSECDTPCPAYPEEDCGGPGLFGYLALNKVAPSGTKGAPKPSSSSSSSKSSKTSDQASETSSDPSSSSKKPKPEKTTSSTSESSTTESEPTSTAVKTVTADGTVKTVFVSPSDTAGDTDTDGQNGERIDGGDSGDGGGLSKGALAGIIIGVAVAVIGIAAALIWFFLRRRKTRREEDGYQEDPSIRGSSSGMMGAGGQRQEMSMGGGSPGSPNTNSNRNSALMIDPRMDPFKQGLYVRSGSHESINTLRDDHDYSRRIQAPRTLRATNPDPETHD